MTGAIERLASTAAAPEPIRPYDVEDMAYRIAAYDSAEYFLAKMRLAHVFRGKRPLIYHAVEAAAMDGLVLEFGVAVGWSICRIAEKVAGPIYGFDSFEGLPEDWTHFQRKGRYGSHGRPPPGLPGNVELVIGLFQETLEPFLSTHAEPIRFLHIDSDLYESARYVLWTVGDRIIPGTVILFDEYFNYPGWQHHEFKAFQEFVAGTGRAYEYLGCNVVGGGVAVRITGPAGAY